MLSVFSGVRLWALGALGGLGFALLAGACARAVRETPPVAEPSARQAAEIRRAVAESPDGSIGVLLRTKGEVGPEQRAVLEACGLRIGSVVGDIVTGRIQADAAAKLAGLPFVRYMEVARTLSPSTPRP